MRGIRGWIAALCSSLPCGAAFRLVLPLAGEAVHHAPLKPAPHVADTPFE